MAGMTDIVILGVVAVGIIYVASNPSILNDLGSQLKIPTAEGSTETETEPTPSESESEDEEDEDEEDEDEEDEDEEDEDEEEEDSDKAFLYGYKGRTNLRRKLKTRRFSGESFMFNNVKVKRISGAYKTTALPPLRIYRTDRVLTL